MRFLQPNGTGFQLHLVPRPTWNGVEPARIHHERLADGTHTHTHAHKIKKKEDASMRCERIRAPPRKRKKKKKKKNTADFYADPFGG